MQKRDYDKVYEKNTGNTETHMAVDEHLAHEDQNAYVEGFASASGVRQETAESGGRIRHPELKDGPIDTHRIETTIEEENPGLADS